MRYQFVDLLLRNFSTILKIFCLFLIVMKNKSILDEFYFISTFSLFIYKLSTLSELNNYRRLSRDEDIYKKISFAYFFPSLLRFFFYIFLLYLVTTVFNLSNNIYTILLFSFAVFITNYLGFVFLVNSEQIFSAIYSLISGLSLFCSILISYFIDQFTLINISLLYFFVTVILSVFFLYYRKDAHKFEKFNFFKLLKYTINKNKNLIYQTKRSFFSLSNLSVQTIVAYIISNYSLIDLNFKNYIIVLIFISNNIIIIFDIFIKFPSSVDLAKGKFKNIYEKQIIIFSIIILLLIILNLNYLKFNTEIITLILVLLLYIFLSFLISLQDFFIQARTVSLKYIFTFIFVFVIFGFLVNYFYYYEYFLYGLILIPRFFIYLFNKIFMNF